MTRLFGCLLLVLAVAVPASGQCVVRARSFVSYSYPVSYPVAYQTPVVAAVFAPLVVAQVPAYSATFGAPQQAMSAGGVGGDSALLAELKALRAEIQAMRGQAPDKMGAAKNGEGVGQDFVNVLGSRCAECHSAPNAKGKFAMFENKQLAALTPAQIGKAMLRVHNGEMPPAPNKPLNDKEFSQVNTGFAQMLIQSAAPASK